MEKKLLFACPWGNDKASAFSGTYIGIYKELEKYYDLIDFDLTTCDNSLKAKWFDFAHKVKRKLFNYNDFNFKGQALISSATNKLLTDDMSVLKFDYYPEIKSENKSYIYRDVHWGYALTMYDRFHDELAYSGFGPITRRALEKLANKEKEIYEHTSCIFTMGKWFAHEVAKDYDLPPNKVVHVGGGINLDKSLIDTSLKQRNKILFVGRDFERKNGPLVVEAFKIAKKCNPELELYIVGPQYLNINYEGIYNLGKLSHKDVAYYFNLCDVFCMPSRHEMYGFVFPEALAFGLPCIVRNAYEMPYFIQDGENGYVMENDSAQNLATVMLKAVDNDRMKKYVMKNREYYLKEYSWNTVAKRMYDVIE